MAPMRRLRGVYMSEPSIYLLLDYRGMFYSSTEEVAGSMNVGKLTALFERYGYAVTVERFHEVDFRSGKYRGAYILYQSSEDPNLKYKDYIEDILLGLELKGAILIPSFHQFRAHHNKVFMEIVRDCSDIAAICNISSKKFGTLEEFVRTLKEEFLPLIIKPGAGSRSAGVGLGRSLREARRYAKRISRSFSLINMRRKLLGMFSGRGYKPISLFRRKFITQNFVADLTHDYKILVYFDRYYLLRRENREDDFRASGSGRLSFSRQVPDGLLDYVELLYRSFNTPFISIDVAMRDGELFLLEFQFVSFGQYALEKSSFFFQRSDGVWSIVEGPSDLEATFAYAIDAYIKNVLSC